MTLIVTTAEIGVRLDSTTTHYEKYLPTTYRKFLVEYDPNGHNIINFFSEDL